MGAIVLILLVTLGSYFILWIAVQSRSRLRRAVLALIAGVLLLMQASFALMASIGGDDSVHAMPLAFAVLYFLSALASIVLVFVRPSAEAGQCAVSQKRFSGVDEDLRPKS